MRNTRRTTFRSAAVVAGAATLLALPVGSALAASPASPGAPGTAPSVRAYVTTVRLADGSLAKVYKAGAGRFEADVLAGSTRLDTLVSKGAAVAYGQSSGLHVVLRPDGTVTSWMEGAPKPAPKPDAAQQITRESSVRVTTPDGRIAKLVDGPKGKRVEVSTPYGHAVAAIDLERPSAYDDGWTYRLVQDGKRVKFVVIDGRSGGNSWVYDFDGRLIETYTVDTAKKGGPGLVVLRHHG
ncbi:hypothetical protein OG444_20825 [Streptomyces sp. NBC_01232]|uniref:hypothetical protein n=1 Tax=Streptomyces sp. NBC_01232 TaxID=2903786 RepID=UPI002E0E5BF1|nr:hypothetical protein OG444_20825 [Streptomyces sp. NBC_01232]